MTRNRHNFKIARVPWKRDHDPRLIKFARRMRTAQTDAEAKLWFLLRRGKVGGFYFRRQVPVAGYILDFYCIAGSMGIEADGGQHLEPDALEYDRRRSEVLHRVGIRIIRFSDYDILKDPDAVQATIYRELTGRPPP